MSGFYNSDGDQLVALNKAIPAGTANLGEVADAGGDESLVNGAATWANSAAVNTPVDVDLTTPVRPSPTGKLLALVFNPSTVTALTGTLKTRWTDNIPTARVATLKSGANDVTIAIPANTTKGFVIDLIALADGGRITFANDTVLGAADGFTARVQVRQL